LSSVEAESNPKAPKISSLFSAAALIGVGLLLNRIPVKTSAFELVSTRLEDWVKMGLGVTAVGKINEATQWKPQAWQHALETVSVLTLIAQGFNLKGWKHFPLLAVSVPMLVQGTRWASDKMEAILDSQHNNLPRWIPKLGITLVSTLGGVYGLRNVMQASWYTGAMGKLGAASGQQAMGIETLICARCGGMHIVCMETISDFVGTMAGWLKELLHPTGVKQK
jgi:hypothetical protein